MGSPSTSPASASTRTPRSAARATTTPTSSTTSSFGLNLAVEAGLTGPAREHFEPLVELTRKLDPTRPVTYAAVMFATSENDRVAELFDVIRINRYYGWYIATGDLAAAGTYMEADLRGWAETFGKRPAVDGGIKVAYLAAGHWAFDRIEAVVGEPVWNFADVQTSHGIHRVDGNRKGFFTRDRRPKAAVHELRRRWLGLTGRKPSSFES